MRVLCVAFQKAMKDNFMHCRVAGLRTANACVKLLDAAQVASKLVPQASILLLDKSAEVRSLAFTLIDSCLELLRANHEAMLTKAKTEGGGTSSSLNISTPSKQNGAVTTAPSSGARSTSAGGSVEDSSSSWSSWSVLQGISKSLESATIVSAENVNPPETVVLDIQRKDYGTQRSGGLKTSTSTASNDSDSMAFSAQQGPGLGGAYGVDDNDSDFDPDMHDDDFGAQDSTVRSTAPSQTNRSLGAKKNSQSGKQGWDEQFDDLDLDDEDKSCEGSSSVTNSSSRHPASVVGGRVGGLGLSVASLPVSKPAVAAPKGMSLKQDVPGKAAKAPKVAVTKLSVSKGEENWDDF